MSAIIHPIAPNSSASWHGQLELDYAQRDGKTIPDRVFVQAPLKVQRPFYPEEEVCHTVMLHTAGGIVGGDRLSLNVNLQPQTHALITSAAAAKIYRSNGREAQQTTQIRVGTAACLEWLPQETIVFDGAQYAQQLKVELEPEAVWMGWEITRLGRSARGERFETGYWRSKIEVWQNNAPDGGTASRRLLWVDPQGIQGGHEMMTSLHGLAGYPVIASFVFVGRGVSPELVKAARAAWHSPEKPIEPLQEEPLITLHESAHQIGVTRLRAGLLCRYRGDSTLEAKRWFVRVWELVRSGELGRSVCVPRVWQV
ncbi:urease accessory protein UreD [Leptolyngbya ohadii]|uniref:urease accessory protein UreD n=1 Tax=Leptolyngbya ohadii TaxID=1962290 RepID=UPI001CECB007|nr:urease accessory protein UreD [Leptolyngbya ohadii]